MRWGVLLGCAALAAAGAAGADSSVAKPVTVAGATVELADRRVVAVRGGVRAPLSSEYAADLRAVEVDRRSGRVHVTFEGDDCGERTIDLPIAGVEARLENAAALVLHRKKKLAEAEAGFRKALALDPDFELAATNLASAQLAQGRRDAALATVAPLVARRPLAIYARVIGDPELAPLASGPLFATVRAATPTAMRFDQLARGGLAVSGSRIALMHWESAYLGCPANADLRVYDVGGGEPLVTVPIELAGEQTGEAPEHCHLKRALEPVRAARVATADRLLADLGFTPAKSVESAPVLHDSERPIGKARLPSFGVVLSDVGRIVRGDRVLATFAPASGYGVSRLQWLPELSAMILYSHGKNEGCAVEPQAIEVVRIELPADR